MRLTDQLCTTDLYYQTWSGNDSKYHAQQHTTQLCRKRNLQLHLLQNCKLPLFGNQFELKLD